METCDSLELVIFYLRNRICHVTWTLIFVILEYLVIWVELMLEYVVILVLASHSWGSLLLECREYLVSWKLECLHQMMTLDLSLTRREVVQMLWSV